MNALLPAALAVAPLLPVPNAEVGDPALRTELLVRAEEKAVGRDRWDDLVKEHGFDTAAGRWDNRTTPSLSWGEAAHVAWVLRSMQVTDERNRRRLREIVREDGRPTVADIGPDGVNAVLRMARDQQSRPAFQRRLLDWAERQPRDALELPNLAILIDDVLMAETGRQRYGTRLEGGLFGPWPYRVEDRANVDARRAEMGLPPLAEYVAAARAHVRDRSDKEQ